MDYTRAQDKKKNTTLGPGIHPSIVSSFSVSNGNKREETEKLLAKCTIDPSRILPFFARDRSTLCLAVSSFIGVGQLLIKEGITSQATLFPFLFQRKRGKSLRDDPSTSSKEKGKVLRVLPSGRWVPRNQG